MLFSPHSPTSSMFTMLQKIPADVPSERNKTWTPSCTLTTIARLEDWWGALSNRSTQPVQPPLSPAHVPTAYPPVQETGEIWVFVQHMEKLLTVILWQISKKQLCKPNKYDFTYMKWFASMTGRGLYRGVLEASWSMTILLPNFKHLLSTNPPWLFPPVPC